MPEFYTGICYTDGMTIQGLLQQQLNFTGNEKSIADYILSHKDDVLQMSIQELAKATYTSTSAIMRLCERMKLSGFKEFKIRFAQELVHSADPSDTIDPNFPFSRNDSIVEISQQLEKLTVQSLQEARKTLSIQDMKRACLTIKNANDVAIFGVGDAYLSGLTFQARMTRAGINFLVTPVYGEQEHLSQTLKPNDCGLLLSYSGSTSSTVRCARVLKKNKVPTICITAGEDSELARICDIALILPAKENKFHRIASFFSQTCMEYYLNIIYSYLYVLDYEQHAKKSID